MLKKFKSGFAAEVNFIVTGDETWLYYYDVPTVTQSKVWVFKNQEVSLREMFGWINQILVGSTIEYGYYTDNQIFGWANKIFWLIKFGWLYQLFWLIQPNTMVNLKKRFCSSK